MMKRLILIISVLWCCSSDSMLDVEPENAVTFTNFFKTEQDFAAINSEMHYYFKFLGTSTNIHVTMGIVADYFTVTSYRDQRALIPSTIVDNNQTNWKYHYDVIHFANLIIDNMYRSETMSKDRQEYYLGQAHFLKGYAYYDLARRWGNAVVVKNSTSQEMLGNSTALEVLDEAIRNAVQAEALLDNYEELRDASGAALTTRQYGSKGAATALLAHAYAWKGAVIDLYGFEGDSKKCYGTSIELSTKLIDGKAGNYALELTKEDLCKNTMTGEGCESIFVMELNNNSGYDFVFTESPGRYFVSWPVNVLKTEADVKSRSMAVNVSRVQDMYEMKDTRRASFFFRLDSMAHDTLYNKTGGFAYVYKWREGLYKTYASGMQSMLTVKADWVIWRLADFYLLRAECYAKLDDDRAKEDLNVIRRKANATEYPVPGESDLKYAIFKEREKELIFEGHRYYDAIRSGLFRTELDPAFGKLSDRDIRDGALYLPIFKSAFTMNDILLQNAYWFKYFN